MAAMLKLCPKEIQDMVELRWDEVGEKYEVCKDRVIGWATTKAEKTPTRGGAVPMDVDGVAAGGEEDCEELPEGWDGGVWGGVPNDTMLQLQGIRAHGARVPVQRKRKVQGWRKG